MDDHYAGGIGFAGSGGASTLRRLVSLGYWIIDGPVPAR
jgi:hypothetical protein